MEKNSFDYLIIGGGLAGGHAVSAIRNNDLEGTIGLICGEQHIPYDRVPLSKAYLMDKVKRESLFFKKEKFYEESNVNVILGHYADLLDPSSKSVKLDDGRELSYSKLLLATGGYPRKLRLPGSDLKGIHYLRRIEDCERIKDAASKSRRAVVVGGGFIGCELASAFETMGLDTTIVEMGPYLLNMAIDETTGKWIGDYYARHGVKVVLNSTASQFLGKGESVVGVETNNEVIDSDFVIVGVGIIPDSKLAEQAKIAVDRGIVVNEYLETDKEGIFAAGDVARFYSPIFKRYLRLEHYDISVKHGTTAGTNMVGKEKKAFDVVPYFYSYQFDLKINAYGDLSHRSKVVTRGSFDEKSGFLQLYFDQDNTLEAVLSVNRPWEQLKKAKALVSLRKIFKNPESLADETKDLSEF